MTVSFIAAQSACDAADFASRRRPGLRQGHEGVLRRGIQKSPGQCRGFCVLEECCGSIPGSSRPAELVIHPDPQHVVCNTRAIATVEEAAAKGSERRQVVSGNLAEVNIEIFKLGGPVAS